MADLGGIMEQIQEETILALLIDKPAEGIRILTAQYGGLVYSITFLRKPLHHQMGFLSVTFAVIYSSLLRFVFLLRLLFRLSIFLDYTTHLVVVKSCIG